MPFFDVNYIAVLVTAVIGFVIGMLWYSPLLFANAWMKLSGIKKEVMEKAKKKILPTRIASFISLLVMTYVLAYFVNIAGASTVLEGAQTGFLLWLGFIASVTLGKVFFLWEGKSVKLYVLNAAHYFVVMITMGAILAVWV